MSETIAGNFSTLMNIVLTYAATLIAESLDVLSLSAALTLAFLAAKMFRKKRSVSKSFQAHDSFTRKGVGSLFKSQRTPVLKRCPSCAQQLPLSVIMCDTCDYNFLAERPGRRQVLLQPPKPLTQETPQQNAVIKSPGIMSTPARLANQSTFCK
ncbi:MAG TPA: hypothetical protein VFX54_19755 [Candidatus Binatia bacterium]|nr:hypothetical protein [Candidatus Binatia bacterium]